jgi:plasmid stabilization system protein ParE
LPSNVVFRPEAEAEALEARAWYESRSDGLGSRFAAALDALDRLLSNPVSFPRVHGEVRRAVKTHFPYAIYFRSDHDEVVVLAIHGRQDPSRWKTRS